MKCSNCGSNNLKGIGFNGLLDITGDARLEGNCGVAICLECGHLELFNNGYAERIKKHIQELKEIKDQIDVQNNRIQELENQKFDPAPFEKEIERLQEELKTLKSLFVGGKDIRAREDGIKDYQKIIDNKQDPNVTNEINRLKCEISKLENKYSELKSNQWYNDI